MGELMISSRIGVAASTHRKDRRMISRLTAVCAVLLTTIAVAAAAPSPALAACSSGVFRAGDTANGVSNAKGVRGVLRTPYSGEVAGFGAGKPSAADVAIINGSDFVQWGWYLGSASQLPNVSTPYVFVGEYYPGQTNNELLRQGQALSWNTYYTFEVDFSSTPGTYYFYLNGQYKFSTTRTHFTQGVATFNGETDNTCTSMRARAYASAPPNRTLQYLTFGSGGSVWHYFSDYRWADSGFVSTSVSDIATDWAYGH
jgi:hypothetical protein